MSKDFNATLNLPQTDFPMRAGLPKREPEMLKYWQEKDLYNRLLENAEGKPQFALHDGPPFSNGNIHMGHALNKILKDIINKSKIMGGYRVPFVPGWDTHGLPIESAILKNKKIKRDEPKILIAPSWQQDNILDSCIDNLLKGASGQAVQNMNLMFGFKEDAIAEFIENRSYCNNIVLAAGKAVRHGEDAHIEYLFNTDLKARRWKSREI